MTSVVVTSRMLSCATVLLWLFVSWFEAQQYAARSTALVAIDQRLGWNGNKKRRKLLYIWVHRPQLWWFLSSPQSQTQSLHGKSGHERNEKIRHYTMEISQPEVYQGGIEHHFHTNRPNLGRTVKIRANRSIDQYRSLDHPNDLLLCYGELCSPVQHVLTSLDVAMANGEKGEGKHPFMQVDICHYLPFQGSFVPIFRDVPPR